MCFFKYKFNANVQKKTRLLVNTNQLLNVNPLLVNNTNFFSTGYKVHCCKKYNVFFTTGLLFKFINLLMKHGKKYKAYTILYQAINLFYIKNLNVKIKTNKSGDFHTLHEKNKIKSVFVKTLFLQAIKNVQPSVEVRNVKVSGRTYQLPAIIHRKRQQILAIRWIIDSAKKRKKMFNINFSECLAFELFEALKKSGKVKQKRDLLHELAESNRAYMRFKWW